MGKKLSEMTLEELWLLFPRVQNECLGGTIGAMRISLYESRGT